MYLFDFVEHYSLLILFILFVVSSFYLFNVKHKYSESNITYYEELIPHSYYEMGLVCRSNGEYLEAKKWLDTADERRNYYTRELMRHRIANALESIKPHIDCED